MSVKRSGLGRGLGALIPTSPTGESGSVLRDIPLSQIRPNQHQPRSHFDEEALSSLVDSIKGVGVIQPVLVRQTEDGFELIAGERRCRAARRAGLQTIPAVVQIADDPDFTANVHTLFNNDRDNSAGFGVGTDRQYFRADAIHPRAVAADSTPVGRGEVHYLRAPSGDIRCP